MINELAANGQIAQHGRSGSLILELELFSQLSIKITWSPVIKVQLLNTYVWQRPYGQDMGRLKISRSIWRVGLIELHVVFAHKPYSVQLRRLITKNISSIVDGARSRTLGWRNSKILFNSIPINKFLMDAVCSLLERFSSSLCDSALPRRCVLSMTEVQT